VAEIQERKTSKTKVGALAQEIKRSGNIIITVCIYGAYTEKKKKRERAWTE
jgi:hypothetical protein